jgi:anti-anti-sigma factor
MRANGGPLGPRDDWSVRRARVGGMRVICAGELDLRCVATFRRELDAALTDEESHVLIDLSEVTFIDCSALDVLVSVSERAGEGAVVLVHPSRAVRRLLTLTGTARLFRVVAGAAPRDLDA